MNSMFRIDQQRQDQSAYNIQPIIFDGVPIIRKNFVHVKHIVSLGIESCSDDRVLAALTMDVISDMIASVLSVYDEDMEVWRRATLQSQVFPDYLTMMDTAPGTMILKDSVMGNTEYFMNSVAAQLSVIACDILNELEYWLRSLITIPRHRISAIQATKIAAGGIRCNIYYLK